MIVFSRHFEDMLKERSIPAEWVDRSIAAADRSEIHDDGTMHYLKRIPEHGDRILRVVINTRSMPHRAVTVFFDRRLSRRGFES